MPALLAVLSWLRRLPGWAWAAAGILAAVAWAYLTGRSRGAEKAEDAARNETLRRHEERADVEEDLARQPADRKRDELRDWSRPGT